MLKILKYTLLWSLIQVKECILICLFIIFSPLIGLLYLLVCGICEVDDFIKIKEEEKKDNA